MENTVDLKKDVSGTDKSNGIVGKLLQSPLFMSFFLCLGAFLVRVIFFRLTYEVSDDYMTDAVLSGALGNGYDPYLLFGNTILGYILIFFYKLIPNISFYFVMLISLGFLSSMTVLYLLFKKKINALTVCLAILFLSFYSDDLYILVQFTKVAAAAGFAGGLLALHGLFVEEKHKVRFVVMGTVLAVFGSFVRFETIYLYGVFLLISFLYYAVSYVRNNKKKENSVSRAAVVKYIVIRLAVCLALVGLLFGLNYADGILKRSDASHKDYVEFQPVRYGITDTYKADFDVLSSDFEKLGLDYVDDCLICSWHFVDREVYSDELLLEVQDVLKSHVSEETHSFFYVFDDMMDRSVLAYPVALALYLMSMIALLLGKDKLFPLINIVVTVGLLAYFVFAGRTMYRVEWGIYFCAVSALLSTYQYNDGSSFAKSKKNLFGRSVSLDCIGGALIALIVLVKGFTQALPNSDFKNMTDEEYRENFDIVMSYSGSYMVEKKQALTLRRDNQPRLIEIMENDPDHYYYVDFPSGIQTLYYNYSPWIRPEQGLFRDSYGYFGSVIMHHPGERDSLAANGCDPDNPYKSLVNDNILSVDNYFYEYKLTYIRKYYYPDAQVEYLGTVDGFMVWNYYIPEEPVSE
ncbi:MAG: hypothetical protein J5476_16970 [Lachnospiraceae bacterium]|nr:hypothetical protein [Lachnospiraceae bacterium]